MSDSSTARSARASIEQAVFSEKLRFVLEATDKRTIVVRRGEKTSSVLRRMRENRAGGILIKEGDRLVGIFTERDYLDKLVDTDLDEDSPIEQFMTPDPRTLSPENTVGDAILLMTGGGYRHVPLLEEDGTIFGLVSVRDVVNFIAEHFPEEVYNHPPVLHQQIETQEGG